MRIYEAYSDARIRMGYKVWLHAQGLSIIRADTVYTRFGSYISRIRSVGYERQLLGCLLEEELRRGFDSIFKEKWKNHLGYPEIPEHFYVYLDYLHSLMAHTPTLDIGGLADDTAVVPLLGAPTRFEERFIIDSKLTLLTNPVLIRKLVEAAKDTDSTPDGMIDICRDFYTAMPLKMQPADWLKLVEPLISKKKGKRDASLTRNLEVTFPDGTTRVLSGPNSFNIVADMIGAVALKNCNVKHMGRPMVTRTVPPKFQAYYRDIGGGLFLNVGGTTIDKFKTLNILNSHFRLRLVIRLTSDKPEPSKGAPGSARRGRKPKSTAAAPEPVGETEDETRI